MKSSRRSWAAAAQAERLRQHYFMPVGPHPHGLTRFARRPSALPAPEATTPGPAYRPRRKPSAIVLLACAIVFAAGCRQDMHNQPKYRPLRASTFFENGASARPLVEGTIARGTLQEDSAFFTGKVGTALVRELPFPVTPEVLDRGQERYDIFCSPCHDRTGSGNGMVVQRGYRQPPSMHIDRLRQVEAGHFFDVMTNGFGAMPDYRAQISPRDRWHIVAYIRALQLSQHAQKGDIPGGDPTKVQSPAAGTGPGRQ